MCDDQSGDNDAKVLCRMGGYESGEYRPSYKQANVAKSSKIWLDDLECTGNEEDVDSCVKNGGRWGRNNCGHNEDVGIKCYGGEFINL